jgi:integrase
MHPDIAFGHAPGHPGWLPSQPDFLRPPPSLAPDAPVPPWRVRALIEDVLAIANRTPRDAHRRRDVRERNRADRRRGARDAALIALAGLCGLPVRDLTALPASSPGERHRQPFLLVPGRIPRELPLYGLAAEAVRLWVEHHHGERSEWLFYGVGKRDGVVLGPLSQQGLSDALKRRAVLDPGVSFRSLASSCEAHLLELGLSRREANAVRGVGVPPRDWEVVGGVLRPSDQAARALRELAWGVGTDRGPDIPVGGR